MKKLLGKLSEMQKLVALAAIIGFAFALIMLIPLFVANQPGWLIGIGIGTFVEIINIILLYKGSEFTLDKLKTPLFLLFYFLRMILFLAGFFVAALLGFGIKNILTAIPAFQYSIWGVLIAYTPMQIIIILIMFKSKKNIVTIAEKKDK